MSLIGACTCGSVQFELKKEPRWLVSCNCSACRKLGTLWAHMNVQDVVLSGNASDTFCYTRGDGATIGFHSCILCGCTTHWEGLTPDNEDIIALNGRLLPPDTMKTFRIREFDGADSWAFLDDE
ncbi:MAG: GFA family protein [Sneathiella sp.]